MLSYVIHGEAWTGICSSWVFKQVIVSTASKDMEMEDLLSYLKEHTCLIGDAVSWTWQEYSFKGMKMKQTGL